jgi:outer membrane protein
VLSLVLLVCLKSVVGSLIALPFCLGKLRQRALIISLILAGTSFPCLATQAAQEDQALTPAFLKDIIKPVYALPDVIDAAASNYPEVKAAYERSLAAKGETSLAKTAYLPRLNFMIQESRATENNIPTVLFPQTTIPVITHPEAAGTRFKGFWLDNFGTLFEWEPFDFGLRPANVKLAKSEFAQATARHDLTRLDACLAAADAFLIAVANQEAVRAYEAKLRRMQTFSMQVHVLVDTGLKPGVDAARADAEVAQIKNELIEAQRATELSLIQVARAIGLQTMQVQIKPDGLTKMVPPPAVFTQPDFEKHPLVILSNNEVRTVEARIHALNRTWVPRFFLLGSLSGRGFGGRGFGSIIGGGVLPQVANYAVGLRISFEAFDYFKVKAQKRIELHNAQANRADVEQSLLSLRAKEASARVMIERARDIAMNTPVFVEAARQTEVQSKERYKVGLNTVVDVAQAEQLLTKAEVENAVAQVGVWRGELAMAGASGDLKPFVNLVTRAEVLNRN